MSRLFITPREVDFINDLSKEIVKDVIGQKIYFFSISLAKTKVHDIYEEAPEKIFDDPIELEALIDWQPAEVRTNQFGHERFTSLEAFVHSRDLIDKSVRISEGDFFSYGSQFFEITSAIVISQIYGEIEHSMGIKLVGREARQSQFRSRVFGPTSEKYSDKDAEQETFVQQRGFDKNKLGDTGDKRALQEKDVLDAPISGPAEVSPQGASTDDSEQTSSFYDET